MDGPGSESVLTSLRDPLRAIGSVVLPFHEGLDEERWNVVVGTIERALATKPFGVRIQVRLFLRAVNVLPILGWGRTLVNLPLDRRAAFLRRLQRSPIMPLRRGLWGVRTLLFMGYYTQERVREEIGYAASPWGWTGHLGEEQERRESVEGPEDGNGGKPVPGGDDRGSGPTPDGEPAGEEGTP